MIETSTNINDIAPALHAAQGAMKGFEERGTNPAFKSKYATLENVIAAAKPALQANGIAYIQATGAIIDGAVEITTLLLHTSGQWLRSTLHMPITKRDPQGVGSATSYGRRYALAALCGLGQADDDGEAAKEEATETAQEAPPPPPFKVTSGTRPQPAVATFNSLLAAINSARSHPLLDSIVNDDAHIDLFRRLDSTRQGQIQDAIAARREYLDTTAADDYRKRKEQ